MRRHGHAAAAAALVLAATLATPATTARAADEAADTAADETAEQLYERLGKELRAAQQKAVDEYKKALEAEQRAAQEEGREAVAPAFDMRAAIGPQIAKYQAAAARFAGTEDAVRFLTWLALYDDGEAGKQAIETILTQHRDEAAIQEFVAALGYLERKIGKERVAETLDALIEKSPHGDVRAQALIVRGESHRRAGDADAARADFERARDLAAGEKVALRAQGILNELDHLQIGKVAPEIEGNDLDGAAMKLSDYRGKVVVLDFWGDW